MTRIACIGFVLSQMTEKRRKRVRFVMIWGMISDETGLGQISSIIIWFDYLLLISSHSVTNYKRSDDHEVSEIPNEIFICCESLLSDFISLGNAAINLIYCRLLRMREVCATNKPCWRKLEFCQQSVVSTFKYTYSSHSLAALPNKEQTTQAITLWHEKLKSQNEIVSFWQRATTIRPFSILHPPQNVLVIFGILFAYNNGIVAPFRSDESISI